MRKVAFYGCYGFNDEWYLVEMLIETKPSKIKWINIVVPKKGVNKSKWQCAYNEQYLSLDGTKRICDLYDEPEENVSPCRVAFFIYKNESKLLKTPYGLFELKDDYLPERLKQIVEFEDND